MLNAGRHDLWIGHHSAGRLTGTDNNTTPNLPHVVLTNSYNAANWRFGLFSTVNGTSDITEIFNHDNIGRTSDIEQYGTGVANKRANFTYNQSGQYTKITRFSDITGTTQVTHSDYVYDSAKRLTSLVHRNTANTALITYSWVYDNQGQVKTFTNPDGTVTFGYDAASQVTSASGGTLSESYTYDKSGNRTIAGYTTGADNRLTSDGTYNYTYDAEGNRTRRTKISDSTYIDYTYDYRNRLTDEVYRTSAGVKTKALHYVYDVNDRRIERQLDATGDGVYESKERYIYDGEDIVLVYDGSNVLVNRYMHGPDFDQPLAEESGGVVKWMLPDEQGSIRDMGDNSGNLVAGSHVIYNSFGVVTSGTPGRYAYTGREWDSDAGMYYYRARWYDANVGRFISQDPKGFDAGDANVYRYVGNNSPNLEDPDGMHATSNAVNVRPGDQPDWNISWSHVTPANIGSFSIDQLRAANSEARYRENFHYNSAQNLFGRSSANPAQDSANQGYYGEQRLLISQHMQAENFGHGWDPGINTVGQNLGEAWGGLKVLVSNPAESRRFMIDSTTDAYWQRIQLHASVNGGDWEDAKNTATNWRMVGSDVSGLTAIVEGEKRLDFNTGATLTIAEAEQRQLMGVSQFSMTVAGGTAMTMSAGARLNALSRRIAFGPTQSAPSLSRTALQNANYAQTDFRLTFSKGGSFAGQTVDDVASALKSGAMTPKQVPIEYIIRDGQPLMLNTRSAQALERAGIPRSEWRAVNVTGNGQAEVRLSDQLTGNKLTSKGTPTVTPRGTK